METSPERLFFMYAFPALASCASASSIEIKDLEALLVSGGSPDKSELEEMFKCAFSRIARMVERDGGGEWSYETVRKYWWEEHNRIIDGDEDGYGDAPQHAKEACKVSFVRVEVVEGKAVCYDNEGVKVRAKTYFEDLKSGDFVTIHLGRIVEKISREEYEEYSKK
jgi:hypothetical protein